MKLEDLKKGQAIELRWEFWDKSREDFQPRIIRMVLLERCGKPMETPSSGWKATVFFDSSPKPVEESTVPYENTYYDTWLKMSIEQNKLDILWTPEK